MKKIHFFLLGILLVWVLTLWLKILMLDPFYGDNFWGFFWHDFKYPWQATGLVMMVLVLCGRIFKFYPYLRDNELLFPIFGGLGGLSWVVFNGMFFLAWIAGPAFDADFVFRKAFLFMDFLSVISFFCFFIVFLFSEILYRLNFWRGRRIDYLSPEEFDHDLASDIERDLKGAEQRIHHD